MSHRIKIKMDKFRYNGVLCQRAFYEAINEALDFVVKWGGTISVVRHNENEVLNEEAVYIWEEFRWFRCSTRKYYKSFRAAWRGEVKIETD